MRQRVLLGFCFILGAAAVISLFALRRAPLVSPGDARGDAQRRLPRSVAEALASEFSGAEVVAAVKESEDGKECYRVTLMDGGNKRSVFVAPDGGFLGVISDELVPADYPAILLGFFGIGLIGSLVAAGVRILWSQVWPENRSVLRDWLVECVGTALVAGLLTSMVATVPREKDWAGLAFTSSVVGGLSASIAEAVVLIIRSARGHWNECRHQLVTIGLTGVVFLCLSIPVVARQKHWSIQNTRSHALRPAVSEAVVP